MEKTETRSLTHLTVPMGGQTIELQEIRYPGGGIPLLRTRIREGRRFTIFDIDPHTALAWADAMHAWATGQEGSPPREGAEGHATDVAPSSPLA